MIWIQAAARHLSNSLRQRQPVGLALFLSLFVHGLFLLTVYRELPVWPKLASNSFHAVLVKRQLVGSNERKNTSPVPTQPIQTATLDKLSRQQLSTKGTTLSQATLGGAKALSKPRPNQTQHIVKSGTEDLATGVGAASEAETTALDPEVLRHYRLALAIQSRRFKTYPAMALQQEWEGRVEVALTFSAHLPLARSSVVRSSGYPILDEQATRMLEQASQATTLPDGLRGKDFRLILPIEFSLDEGR